MSTTFRENNSTIGNQAFRILEDVKVYDPASDPKVRKRLAYYVDHWMQQNGRTHAREVEQRAKKLGVGKGVSDANVGKLLTEKEFEPGIYTLRNLAITLGRPPEEMFMVAMGKAELKTNGENEEITSLAEIYKTLPETDRPYFKRQIQSMIRDMASPE